MNLQINFQLPLIKTLRHPRVPIVVFTNARGIIAGQSIGEPFSLSTAIFLICISTSDFICAHDSAKKSLAQVLSAKN